MSKLIVYSASAGSGKTYKITEEYLRLLFKYPYNFRHILAITFTNKAAAEMKERVINELFKLTNNLNSGYLDLIKNEFKLTEDEVKQKAEFILKLILHNYSHFSIGTIDSFFHRVIQSFVREIGLQMGFELELDNIKVLNEVIDLLFIDVDENETLRNWMVQFTEDKVEEGKSWNLKNDIINLGKEVFKEIFQLFNISIINKLSDKKFLNEYLQKLLKIKNQFENYLSNLGKEALALIENHSLEIVDFSYGKTGFANYFYKIANKSDFIPGKRVYDALNVVENWYSKNSEFIKEIEAVFQAGLNQILVNTVDYYEKNYHEYFTSKQILANFYTLGLLTDISQKIRIYTNNNNLFLLADVAKLLYTIIKDNETPFIYEKTGSYYRHFMIDEFQDTSEIQWKNIKPLVLNSLSENNLNLLVGDVKQSIYRWRNSNWQVLAEELENDFAIQGLDKRLLNYNWRSSENIVNFNNFLFSDASKLLQSQYNDHFKKENGAEELYKESIITAYQSNIQSIPDTTKKGGLVYFEFIDNKDQDWKDLALKKIPLFIKRLQDKGIRPGETAILTRRRDEGELIANYLYDYTAQKAAEDQTSYEVISDESLFISSSPLIKFIVSVFRYLNNPNDNINKALLLSLFHQYINNNNHDCISINKNLDFTEQCNIEFFKRLWDLKFFNLYESVEQIIQKFTLFRFEGQISYLRAFQDLIIDYTRQNIPDKASFLKWWEEEGIFKAIPFTEGIEAIRILTIHKAKGLEFKAVIIPFCDWRIDHNPQQTNIIWCKPNSKPFDELELVPVKYSSILANTIFKDDYFIEKMKVYIDNLNLLYVAFTRAKDVLIATGPDSYKNEIKNVSDILKCVFEEKRKNDELDTHLVAKLFESYAPDKNYIFYGDLEKIDTNAKKEDMTYMKEVFDENIFSYSK
ncbi:MAG: UvrD-helicase domain-containing protein, partial [Bacteroidales bacterium]|nr:UvrD-helicase domain-containing protein [Bacteroidales bacterium]